MVISTYVVGCLPNSSYKKSLNKRLSMFCFDFLTGALSLVCRYHNRENVPQRGICVANHTSPMDVLVLACDNTYDMVSGSFRFCPRGGVFVFSLPVCSEQVFLIA